MKTTRHVHFYTCLITAGLLLFVSINDVLAQKLTIKNTKNGKVRVLEQGQKMSLKFSVGDDYAKGKIQSFTDSTVVLAMLDEEEVMLREVKLKEIYSIKKTSSMHKVAQVAGALVMVGGAAAIFEAPGIAGEDGNDWLVRGAGIAAIAVGLIPYLIKPTEFIQGTNAEYTIVK